MNEYCMIQKGDIMLRELRIKNFKGWQDTGLLKLAPLTIFFGANSSGKSSIGQLLLLLKQSIDSPDRNIVLSTGSDKTPMQFNKLSDLMTDHDLNK